MAQINIITKHIVGYYVYVNEFCKLRESLKSFRDLHDQIDQIVVPADIHESYDLTRIKNALDKDSNLFVVGDSKQSIYSFQGAEIEVFNETQLKEANKRIVFFIKFIVHFSQFIQLLFV